MNRPGRFSFNLFAPIVIAAALLTLAAVIAATYTHPDLKHVGEIVGAMMLIGIFAGVFGIFPSLVHALLMEAVYLRLAAPNSWRAVAVSAVSGSFAGTLIAGEFYLLNGGQTAEFGKLWALYPAFGFIVGVIVGLFVRSFRSPTVAEVEKCHDATDTEPSIF